MRPDMAMTPRVPPTSDDIRSEFCTHCEAQPEVPCANFGALGEPTPACYEFHAARVHAATSRRLQAEAVEDSLHLVASLPGILNTDEGEAP